jgi:hypothetical protein
MSCSGSGSCTSQCFVPHGCFGPGISAVCTATIPCTTVVAGWSGSSCDRWGNAGAARCTTAGNCATASDVALCGTSASGTANTRVSLATCDTACVDATKCVPGSLIATADTVAEVCKIDSDAGSCADIQCSNFVKGWAGNACQLYGRVARRIGRCNSTGACFGALEPVGADHVLLVAVDRADVPKRRVYQY